jgi:hypothetical protein
VGDTFPVCPKCRNVETWCACPERMGVLIVGARPEAVYVHREPSETATLRAQLAEARAEVERLTGLLEQIARYGECESCNSPDIACKLYARDPHPGDPREE